AEDLVPRAVDDAHAALADLLAELVLAGELRGGLLWPGFVPDRGDEPPGDLGEQGALDRARPRVGGALGLGHPSIIGDLRARPWWQNDENRAIVSPMRALMMVALPLGAASAHAQGWTGTAPPTANGAIGYRVADTAGANVVIAYG